MEAINSQVGQTFAVNSRQSADLAAEQQASRDAQTADRLAEPSERVSGTSVSPERSSSGPVQDNVTSADTIDSGEQQPDIEEIESATRDIEQFLQAQNRNLAFSVDSSTQRSVVTVTEANSGDVIRQIPSEEVLRLAERLRELQTDVGSSVGVLFNNQV